MTSEIALWSAPLDVPAEVLARFEQTLSADEQARADSLRGALLRRRYVADHGWRRQLLGGLLGCPPSEVRYTRAEHGKPQLTGTTLRFNASRSAGVGLYVTAEGVEVGIDIEAVRGDIDLAAMGRRFFSPSERAALERVSAGGRAAAAFACWTRKEAYAKAVGTGLVFPLTEVEVWAGDERPVRRGTVEIHAVDGGPGMAAAVAIDIGRGGDVSIPGQVNVIS